MKDDFQSIEETLSDGILAAYLLGFDTINEENRAKIKSLNFAEGDEKKSDDKLVKKIGTKKLGLQLRFDVPPKEAIDYFKRKQIFTKKEFNKLERKARAAAFTIQGIYETDVLEAFKNEISKALETGQTQKFVVDRFKKILDGAGHKQLGDFHLESIFRTNMQMAYGVGRRKAMEDSADDLPYWEYSAVGDDRTRPSHQALDGITFPANHPFWDTHYPNTDLLEVLLENAKRQLIIKIVILWKERNMDLNLTPNELRKKRLEWITKTLKLDKKLKSFTELNIEQLKIALKNLR